MRNYNPQFLILRSKLKRYITLFFTLVTSSIVMGQEITIPIKTVTATPDNVPSEHKVDGHQSHAINNIIDGNVETTWISDQTREIKILDFLQLSQFDNTDNGMRNFIEVAYVPNKDTEIEIKFSVKAGYNYQHQTQYLFGCGNPRWGSGISLGIFGGQYVYKTSNRAHENIKPIIDKDDNINTIVTKLSSITVNGEELTGTITPADRQNTPDEITGDKRLNFFSSPNDDQKYARCFEGKIYSVKIRENGKLCMDLMPAAENGFTGFYDRISTNFYKFNAYPVDYVENINETNSPKDRLHVKIPLSPEPASGYEWSKSLVQNRYLVSDNLSSFRKTGNATTPTKVNDNGVNAVKVSSSTRNQNVWDSQLFIDFNEPLIEEESYYISFAYKASASADVNVYMQGTGNDIRLPNNASVNFGTEWKTVNWTGTIPNGRSMNRLAFHLNVEQNVRDYYITNIVVKKQVPTTPAASGNKRWSDNLVHNGTLETDDASGFEANRCSMTVQDNELKVVSSAKSQDTDPAWYSQFFIRMDDKLLPGETVYVSFDYRAKEATTAYTQSFQNGRNTNSNFLGTLNFATNWKTYSNKLTISADQGKNGGLEYIGFNLNDKATSNDFFFRNVVVRKETTLNAGKKWSENLVNNGNFSGTDLSSFPQYNLTEKINTVNGQRVLEIVTSTDNQGQGFIQFNQNLNKGDKYTISFEYKADAEVTVGTEAHETYGTYNSWNPYGELNFTNNWKTFTYEGTVDNEVGKDSEGNQIRSYKSLKFRFPQQAHTYHIRNVVVRKQVDADPVPSEPALDEGKQWSKLLVKNGSLSTNNIDSYPIVGNTTRELGVYDGKKALKIINSETENGYWKSCMFINLDGEIQIGEKFYVSFDYAANKTATITSGYDNASGGVGGTAFTIPDATTSWQSFTSGAITFDGNNPMTKIVLYLNSNYANNPTTFYFTNIVVKKMVPIDVADKPVSKLTIKFKNLNTNAGESYSVRHLFSLGTHEDEVMALTTKLGKYNYVSGGKTKETNISIDQNEHTATFKAGELTIDGTQDKVDGVPTWNSYDALYLMGTHCDPVTNHNGYAPRSFYGQIYSATLTENGIKRLDLIPAMNQDGEYGFIDKLTNTFYGIDGCSGTGADGKLGGGANGYGGGATETRDFKMPFKIDFTTGHPQVVRDFAITTANRETNEDQVNYNNPLKWVLYGSNNGNSWKQLKESDIPLDINGQKYTFTLTDNTESFSQYRFIVEKVNVANKSDNPPFSRVRLADISLSTEYVFKHYHGRVYDENTLDIPENLRVGGSSGYQTDYKTSNDDIRLNNGVNIQRTHEYEHVVYVYPGKTVNLTPFSDFDIANVTNDETWNNAYNYREQYIRWYDYNTDLRSDNLTFDPRNGHEVNALTDGHFAWNHRSDGCRTREGSLAKYTADANPTADANGVIDVIALEAANDFECSNGTWENNAFVIKEPTLQWRHTFVIKDARVRANEMATNNADYIAKNKITLMCPANTPFQYPLPCFEYAHAGTDHPTDYYIKDGDKYEAVQHYLIETIRGDGISTSTYLDFTDGNVSVKKIGSLSLEDVAYSFKEKDNYNRVFYLQNPVTNPSGGNGVYTIKIYAYNESNSDKKGIQLMEYELQVLEPKNGVMVNAETLYAKNTSNEYTYSYQNQIPEIMDQIFGTPTTKIDFDNINSNDVTSVSGNHHYFKWPWQWENSSYGFGYEDRGDYNMYMVADHMTVTPYHGREDNASDKESYKNVYDRLYYDDIAQGKSSGDARKGYFFYANAASDPSRMAVLNIGKDFCPNTKVYVSAWINEFQGQNLYAETANVIFSFRGVKADGTEKVLNSFVSGYVSGGWNTPSYRPKTRENNNDVINHVDNTNPDNRGKWMHVYYTFSTTDAATDFDHYIITLENNCTSSEGADYAIDDIRAYVLKPNLQARLVDPVCNKNEGTKIEIYGDFEQLIDAYFPDVTGSTTQTLKYCFLDKEKFDNIYDPDKNNSNDAFNAALIQNVYNSGQDYGTLTFNTSFNGNIPYVDTWYAGGSYDKYYQGHKPDIGDIIIFPCDATDVKINPGKSYILAIAKTGEGAQFVVEGKCSRTSVFKIPNPIDIKIDGTLQTTEGGVSACANQRPEVNIDMNGVSMGGTPVTADVLKFDWYYGPLSLGDISDAKSPKYQGYTRSYENEKLEEKALHSILSKFRELNSTADDEKVLGFTGTDPNGITIDSELTNEMVLYIKELILEGRLTLYKDKAFATAHLFGEDLDPAKQKYFYITALPINPEQQVKEKNPEINSVKFCLDPIGVSIKINELTPTMKDGDSNVNYPAEMYDVPLRIGLKQLKRTVISNLADNSTKEHQLWLPLRAITPVTEEGQEAGTTLIKNDDDLLYLVNSNDPEAMEVSSGASIAGTSISDKVVVIGKLMDISAVKNGSNNVCKISFLKSFKFREGYWYTMKFHFSQQGASRIVCPGDLIFTIKVVPEYQMWTGAVSRNWNDDDNWKRVTKEDLLWNLNNADVKDDAFLTNNADYITDGNTNDRTFSFAPADFTKVIIPAEVERVPFMYDMRSNTANQTITYAGAPKAGLQIVNGEPTDVATIGKPTETVIYDMASIDRSDYDVATRPWYDHTCDQIHFNAGAILMDQRYLYYNKAWCDIDVPVGTWQTVASPLMNIVAGDLYLPTATARQQTPLFEDITYRTSLNDRFKPAVFQRSWNKSMAKVYKLDGNMDDVGVKLDWSHVYNDVNVRYGAGQGFSIKVDVSAMPTGDQPTIARFRFPKADTQYTYYNPGNADGDKKTESVNSDDIVGGVRPGKLSDLTGTFQQMVGDTGNNQNPATPTNYFLVGNPLICWLNMQKFFDNNTQFERKYWIASADGQRTALFTGNEGWVSTLDGDAQFLAPGISFFVELKQGQEDATGQPTSGATNVTPTFTVDMMSYVQGEKSPTTNNDSPNSRSRAAEQSYIPQLRLTSEDGNGRKSVAILTDGTVAKHDMVETLFDSNLKDDIFLYTTKNGQAQSIANIMPGDTLPLVTAGLVDDVMLHIEGAEDFDCPLYIIDSEEGTIEPLTSDISLNCSTRGVRYYITSPKDKKEEMTISAPRVTAGNGRITIYAPANAIIEWAEIHSTNGTLVEKENDIDYSYSATLPSAIYLVRLSVEGHVYTYKLLLTDK